MDNKNRDNNSKQKNPNNEDYWKSRGYSQRPHDWQDKYQKKELSKSDRENRSKQMNSNNDAYYKARYGSSSSSSSSSTNYYTDDNYGSGYKSFSDSKNNKK